MLRAVWSGSISFGLVGIPVKAMAVQSPKDIRFELLHGECRGKTTQKRYCPRCERDVPEEEMVRGFPHTKGQYIVIEPAEFEALGTPAKHTLQILDFVSMSEIDPIYYERPYYLQPGEGGERTYTLLHRVMTESNRVGIGKVALRDREHLAVIRPTEKALVMELIAFPDEVRLLDAPLAPLDAKIDDREMAMAQLLLNSMAGTFDPTRYRDDYREQLTRVIQEKVETGAISMPAAQPVASAAVSDLMEMLRRSVEMISEERAAPAGEAVPAGAAVPAAPNGHGSDQELAEALSGRGDG